ncbi:MAG: hypothetical protein KIT79_16015 [Deltaproteobacteria bacterium]|nr:hypothetical protein [Deltaproteobacteria bacterium]
MPEVYPVIEEGINAGRMNPAPEAVPESVPEVSPAAPAPRKSASELFLIGILRGLVYVDARRRRVGFQPKETILLCGDGDKRLVFCYGARGTRAQEMSRVILGHHEEFNGFRCQRVLSAVHAARTGACRLLGDLVEIVYWSDKCIDGESCKSPSNYHHLFEPEFPQLYAAPGRHLLAGGGSYKLTRRGIVG